MLNDDEVVATSRFGIVLSPPNWDLLGLPRSVDNNSVWLGYGTTPVNRATLWVPKYLSPK